jgi:hypothetical protein
MKNREDVFYYVVVTFGVFVISLWVATMILKFILF